VAQRERSAAQQPDCAWAQLVQRAASGERDALTDLYDQTSALVYSLALRILGDEPAAEDVVIEVYTHAWRMASTFEPARGTASAWLLTVTRSRAIDALRARRRNRAREPLEAAVEVPSDAAGPEELNVAAERQRFVANALESLGNDQREAIELAYFSGLSHSEIAARLQQPLGTVKTRIRLGMMKLRELLGGLEPTLLVTGQERTA
jgi:RNA polymerase sigma-70 factor, ECF subfamily